MNFTNSKTIKKIISYPWQETIKALRYLPKALTLFEKITVLVLLVGILSSLGLFWYRSFLASTKLIPTYGGDFREGVVGDAKDFGSNSSRLINAGLTKYDENKNIVGDLAASWDINDGGKSYVFHLRSGFSSSDLMSQISANGLWGDIAIDAPDEETLTFTFKQPFSPFLNVSTKPIFNYGPYQITKESKDSVELQARDDYYGGRPYIDRITFVFFSSFDDLQKAVKRGDVQGYSATDGSIAPMKDSRQFEMDLPRDLDLFFNLNNKTLADINVRKALKENTSLPKAINLRLVTSDASKNLDYAKKLQERWAQIGATVTLDVKDNVTLQKTTIPKRDYDVLLYGLDYGEDPDPYPFWHSSQIGENGRNLSNFNNKQADKLLESARQEMDQKKRQDMYAQFQTILESEIPMFVVEHQNFSYQLANSVQGVNKITGSSEADRFLNVSTWYIKTKRVRK